MTIRRDKGIIARFFSGRLSKKDKKKFLEKASSDKEFIKEFVKAIEVNEVIEDEFEQKDEPEKDGKRKRKKNRGLIFILPAAILCLSAIVIIPFPRREISDVLFEKFYEPLDASDGTRRGMSMKEQAIIMSEGISLYLDDRYDTAIDYFLKHKPQMDTIFDGWISLFVGLSYIGLGDCHEAIRYLEPVVLEGRVMWPEASWYLGLCYVKVGEFDKAKTHIRNVASFPGMFGKRAKKLYNRLKLYDSPVISKLLFRSEKVASTSRSE